MNTNTIGQALGDADDIFFCMTVLRPFCFLL